MTAAKSFRDLRVYNLAREQARSVYEMSQAFPKEEVYALTDQIRRSSRAVGALIAEAWGRRRYPDAFSNKLSSAIGEAHETQAWLDYALDCGYIAEPSYEDLNKAWQAIGGMLYRMIQNRNHFCRHVAKK